jgi:hypothetical protein
MAQIPENNQKPVFTFGKFKGRVIEEICDEEPGYIVWAFNNVQGHGGITRDQYLCAQRDDMDEDDGLDELDFRADAENRYHGDLDD